MRNRGAGVGGRKTPPTPAAAIEPILPEIDMVLVMSVWPGFGGQAFIPDVLPKLQRLKTLLDPHQRLEIDGGIDAHTISKAVAAGADTLVAGSAIFEKPDPVAAMNELRALAEAARRT